MQTIQSLERELVKAKADQKQKELIDELTKSKSEHLNKCTSTHTFQRYTDKAIRLRIRKIKNVLIQSDKIVFIVDTIEYMRTENGNVDFSIKCDSAMTLNTYDFMFRYSITEMQFESVKRQATAEIDILGETIRANIKVSDYITNGDDSKERSFELFLKNSGCPYIDLSKIEYQKVVYNGKALDISISELLCWNNHPFLICKNYLLRNKYSKIIIEKIIKDLEKGAEVWGSSIRERDIPRSLALRNFIDSEIFD